jgi:hypothetical protein
VSLVSSDLDILLALILLFGFWSCCNKFAYFVWYKMLWICFLSCWSKFVHFVVGIWCSFVNHLTICALCCWYLMQFCQSFDNLCTLLLVFDVVLSIIWHDVIHQFIYSFFSPLAWYAKMDRFLIETGFFRCHCDPNVYTRKVGSHLIILVLYVDDLILTGSD